MDSLSDKLIFRIVDAAPIIYGIICGLNNHYYDTLIGKKEQYKDMNVKPITNMYTKYGELPNGWRHGKRIRYYESGAVGSVANYVDDVEQGEFKKYYESGKLKFMGMCKNGKLHGLCTNWREDGSKCQELHYHHNNELISVIYDTNGNINIISIGSYGNHVIVDFEDQPGLVASDI
jgi:antitoxin component YwqK of YwqJK toxin-antitoxin module